MNIVYVLTNPAMPGLVKIGQTTQEDANLRIAQLYTTGVPVPFRLEFACRVDDSEGVEEALHIAFAPNRVNPRREFFRIAPEQAIAILRLLHSEDATVEVAKQPTDLDQQSLAAAEQLRSRRPASNFEEMGIPVGSILQFTRDATTVVVVGPRKVKLGDEEMSLTAATRQLLAIEHNVQPSPYWMFEGRSLSEIYEETYGDDE
jgi:T5orf172 domain